MSLIHSAAGRLYIVVAIIFFAYVGARFAKAGLEPPDVQMPDWTFAAMPLQFGSWHGKPTQMDPRIAIATEAKVDTIVDRVYSDNRGHNISMHTAMFDNPRGGAYHSPMNCYRSSGWQNTNETREDLEITDDLTIPVSVSTWERKREKIIVVYWFQLGEHVLFSRLDLGVRVRWALRKQSKWPALIKVMLQISARDPEEAKSTILDFAKQVAVWENQPSHRRQMLGDAASTSPSSDDAKK